MTTQDSTTGFPIEQVQEALASLGVTLDPQALDRPAIATGQLLAISEFIARVNATSAVDMKDLMHGYYGTVVALGDKMGTDASALRVAFAEDRLRRTQTEANLAGEDANRLSSALSFARVELGRLRTTDGSF